MAKPTVFNSLRAKDELQVGSSGNTMSRVVTTTVAIDFASIAAGAVSATTVALANVAEGAAVFINPGSNWSGQYNYLNLNPLATAAGVVTILASNHSAGAIDAASSTFRLTGINF